jgi:hypothetical protein
VKVGIFSKKKKDSSSIMSNSASRAQEHETSLEDKAQIIVEFVQDFRDSGEYEEFFDDSHLGIPLAIAITQDMADLTNSGLGIFEETWSQLCDLFGMDETAGYESIEDLMENDE